jgi:hypothetical protein
MSMQAAPAIVQATEAYWVQVPADAVAGSQFVATVGSSTAILTVPAGTPAGSWIVVSMAAPVAVPVATPVAQHEPVAAPVATPVAQHEPVATPVVVQGVPIADGSDAASTLQVMRGALAQCGPLWDTGAKERAEELLRAAYDDLAGRDPRFGEVMAGVERNCPHEPRAWHYRRVFDTLVLEEMDESDGPRNYYLYYWDTRDGVEWMGWWITPEQVGSTRFEAHAAVDVATPDLCAGHWKNPYDNIRTLRVVAAPASGAMLIGGDVHPVVEGCYVPVPEHAHNHAGASSPGERRLVYRLERPLNEAERELVGWPPAAAACCALM